MATDPQTGDKGPRTVKALIRNTGPHLMVAVGTNKAGVENTTSDTIDATDNHPFWVQSRGEWVDANSAAPPREELDRSTLPLDSWTTSSMDLLDGVQIVEHDDPADAGGQSHKPH